MISFEQALSKILYLADKIDFEEVKLEEVKWKKRNLEEVKWKK